MSSDTTIGVSEKTREALGKEKRKGESLDETVSRLINESNDGKICPKCGSQMKLVHPRPFDSLHFDLECTNCDYLTTYEALKGVKK